MTSNSAQLGGKRPEFLKAVAPEASRPADFESAFAAMTRGKAQALFGAAGLLTTPHRQTS